MRGTNHRMLIFPAVLALHVPLRLPAHARSPCATASIGGRPSGASSELASEAAALATRLRRAVEDAEDEVRVEVEHSKKFMWRGDGLRADFRRSGMRRRRALVRGASENERALWAAMREAESAGLPHEYLEEALRVANELAVARVELQREFDRELEGPAVG